MNHLWQSQRLVYRAIKEEDEAFLANLHENAQDYLSYTPYLPVPQGKKHAQDYREWLASGLMSALVCLPSASSSADEGEKVKNDGVNRNETPVGVIGLLDLPAREFHHRRSEITLTILHEHQRKGYGSEAINWALNWAFRHAGLHRVGICAIQFSPDAWHLYERLGFRVEGRMREFWWHDMKFWDVIQLSMLDREWQEIQEKNQ